MYTFWFDRAKLENPNESPSFKIPIDFQVRKYRHIESDKERGIDAPLQLVDDVDETKERKVTWRDYILK